MWIWMRRLYEQEASEHRMGVHGAWIGDMEGRLVVKIARAIILLGWLEDTQK